MAFVMLLVFLLIYFIRPQDFWPYLLEDRLIFITLGLASVVWAISLLFTKKRIFRSPQSIFMVGLWFAVVLSTFTVGWKSYIVDTFVYFAKITLVYYLVSDLIDSQGKFKAFVWFLVLACGVLAVFGILQHYGVDITGAGLMKQERIISGVNVVSYRIRGAGIFDTNQLAYTIGMALPLAFLLLTTTRFIFGKLLSIVLIMAFGYCVYLTQSRGGMAAFMFSLLLLLTIRGRFGAKIFSVIIVGMVVMAILSGSQRFGTVFQYKQDQSAMARLDAWYVGSLLFREYPITGVGFERFKEMGKQVAGLRIVSHNGYVQVAAETGLIGLFFWSGLMFFSIRSTMRLQPKTIQGDEMQQMSISARCLTVAFFQFLIACFFSGDAFDFTIYLMFGCTVALEAIAKRDGLIECQPPQFAVPLITKVDMIKVAAVEVLILAVWKLALTALL